MKDFALTASGKTFARNGYDLRYTQSNSEYVAQKIRIRLSIFRGEYYLDNSIGVPYLDGILEKNPDLVKLEAEIKAEIRKIPEVLDILAFSYQNIPETRTAQVSVTVQTSEGSVGVTV